MVQKKEETSIIEIIQKMVKEGESEASIVKTLKELGVSSQKAKKLLLLGEADTFAILRGDITKIVKANIEEEKIEIKKLINDEVEKNISASEKKVQSSVISDLQHYEKDIDAKRKSHEEQANENIEKVTLLTDRVKGKLNDLGSAVRQVQMDLDELKLRGVGSRQKSLSTTLIILGLAFALIDIYLLLGSYNTNIQSVDALIVMVLIAMISITMIFVSTLV